MRAFSCPFLSRGGGGGIGDIDLTVRPSYRLFKRIGRERGREEGTAEDKMGRGRRMLDNLIEGEDRLRR